MSPSVCLTLDLAYVYMCVSVAYYTYIRIFVSVMCVHVLSIMLSSAHNVLTDCAGFFLVHRCGQSVRGGL